MTNEDKTVFYNKATKKILNQLAELKLPKQQQKKAVELVNYLRESFKKEEVKKATLSTPEYPIWDLKYDSAGFCRVSSITFMYAMDCKDWQLMSIDDKNLDIQHHWLKHIPTGKVLDLTYDQFAYYGQSIPYEIGQKTAPNISLEADEVVDFTKSIGFNLMEMIVRAKRK